MTQVVTKIKFGQGWIKSYNLWNHYGEFCQHDTKSLKKIIKWKLKKYWIMKINELI